MELEEAKKLGLELIETAKAVYLSTVDSKGYPITRAMVNVRNKEQYPEFTDFFDKQENKFVIFFSTNTSSTKIDHIKKNPKVSVYFCDPEDFKGIMFSGEVEMIEDMDIKREFFLESSIRYYPKGVEDPDYTILRLNPKAANLYYRLQKTNFELGE